MPDFLGRGLRWNPPVAWDVFSAILPDTRPNSTMAPRANWKSYLKLSLASCGVALYPGTTTRERVRFNIINRKTGNRVRSIPLKRTS
jgi:hypothetical protein